jgi:hypothetical protein
MRRRTERKVGNAFNDFIKTERNSQPLMIEPGRREQGLPARRHDDCLDNETPDYRAVQGQPRRDDMYALVFARQNTQTEIRVRGIRKPTLEMAQIVGAAVGLFGGVGAALFGSVFTVASWLASSEGARQWLSTAGTALLLLTIPLIIFGGYCMDWVEKDKPQRDSEVMRYKDDDEEQ